MHRNTFFIVLAIFCIHIQLICMNPSKDPAQNESKKILAMLPAHIHHENECLKALTLAFNQIQAIKDPDSFLEAGQYGKSLAELKELWDAYTELEHQDKVLTPIYPNQPQDTLKFRQEYATNFLLTSIKLMNEEKNKTIKTLRIHRIALCGLASLLTVFGVCANFYTYYGICNKI